MLDQLQSNPEIYIFGFSVIYPGNRSYQLLLWNLYNHNTKWISFINSRSKSLTPYILEIFIGKKRTIYFWAALMDPMLATWAVYWIYSNTFSTYTTWEFTWLFDGVLSPTTDQSCSFWYIHFQSFLRKLQFLDGQSILDFFKRLRKDSKIICV